MAIAEQSVLITQLARAHVSSGAPGSPDGSTEETSRPPPRGGGPAAAFCYDKRMTRSRLARGSPAVLGLLAALLLLSAPGRSAVAAPPADKLVVLDASNLAPGPLSKWANTGTAGGSFAPESGKPLVEDVAGRRAVTFGGGEFLRASFPVPAGLVRRHPFTAAAWILDRNIESKKIVAAWAPWPGRAAEFGIGRGRNAAFAHSALVKLGFEGGVPESGAWHHIAVSYDGEIARVYVDGRPNAAKAMALDIGTAGPFLVGAGWDAGRRAPVMAFDGSLASLVIVDAALSPVEIWTLAGRRDALLLEPAVNAVVENVQTRLSWRFDAPFPDAVDLYFGLRRDEVETGGRSSPSFRTTLPGGTAAFGPVTLVPGLEYFWRVDGVDRKGRVARRGETAGFFADSGAARSPEPRDGISAVRTGLSALGWRPGRFAMTQNVYFGDSRDAVVSSRRPIASGLSAAAGSAPLPGPLEPGRGYYWRVETLNGGLPAAPGDVWSFRTADAAVPDEVTFFAASDPHYGESVTAGEANRLTVDLMNNLPGEAWPEKLGGGPVRTPAGVVMLGDLVDGGEAPDAPEVWSCFAADYGVKGEGRLAFPVYESAGNHDGGFGAAVPRAIAARTLLRAGLAGASADGLQYSWDWAGVHFVHLGFYGEVPDRAGGDRGGGRRDGRREPNRGGRRSGNGSGGKRGAPIDGLVFLRDDLARRVGSSGRPVVLFQHCGWDDYSRGLWLDEGRAALADALAGYRVAAIFWGHAHFPQRIDWRGISTFCVGSTRRDAGPGGFFVVRIRAGGMAVALRTRQGWGMESFVPLDGTGLTPPANRAPAPPAARPR